jgi:hypothetical protein
MLRWKLLRRRLSVSAPRVAVRSQLPWPLRWALVAAVLGFSAALGLWAFEFGRDIAGLDRNLRQELVSTRSEIERLRTEHDLARQKANAAESLLAAERAAQNALAAQVRQLEAERQALRADLGFFERLLPAAGDGLQVRGLRAEAQGAGQLRWQMLLTQNTRAAAEFTGRVELVLSGQLDGRPWTWSPPDGPQPLRLRQYLRLEGIIDHPPGAVIKMMQARVADERGATVATQTLRL